MSDCIHEQRFKDVIGTRTGCVACELEDARRVIVSIVTELDPHPHAEPDPQEALDIAERYLMRGSERHETKAEAAAAKVLQASHCGDQNFIAALRGPECEALRSALLELVEAYKEEMDNE